MTERESRLEELIARYLQAAERGETIDGAALAAECPEVADELLAFIADHDHLSAAVRASANRPSELDAPQLALTVADRDEGTAPLESPAAGLREFGEYELLAEIARGGMGIVYQARHKRLNRVVALKMILGGPLARDADIQRFYQEAEAAARMQHSGIVPIYDVGQVAGVHYYTMSLIQGRSLADVLREKPLEPREAAQLLKKLALAVAYAHARQVVHRDLKPANILLDARYEPLITDFGLAKRLDCGQELTASGQILGTLPYMAPEQAIGRNAAIGPAADIYGLGAVLYAMLTGQPPFTATTQMDLLLSVVESEPVPPRRLRPIVPPALQRICLRCLEKDPQRRYQKAEDLAHDLDLFLRGDPPVVAKSSVVEAAKRFPRSCPPLSAHLVGLLAIELFRQVLFLLPWTAAIKPDWQYHLQFTGLFALWAVACVFFQMVLNRPRSAGWGRYAWATADVAFLTWGLLQARGPLGPLLSLFTLLVVASISFFRVRLTVFVTLASLAAVALILALRPPEPHPHYAILAAATLGVSGLILGYHIRRMRLLSEYYERMGHE